MRIISGIIPGASRLARLEVELSRKARQRLKWFDYYDSRSHNARLTCRHFDISPQTFYRWKRCYNPRHLESLEDRSHRPRHLRQPTYSVELVEAVLQLREGYPRWGKDTLVVLLHGEGFTCSTSTVGRILNRLKERGVLKELIPNPHFGEEKAVAASLCHKKAKGVCGQQARRYSRGGYIRCETPTRNNYQVLYCP